MKAEQDKPKNLMQQFPIVGVGASAGGIESFKKLLKNTDPDANIAYVLVQHLDPSHKSILADILSKVSKLPVEEINKTTTVAPNKVYIIPSNQSLSISGLNLVLEERNTKHPHLPIDSFFTSLATEHKNFAVGIVLSGNANDGSIGLKRIKENGGFCFAEDPETLQHNSMPQNAIDEGAVDFVLKAEDMPTKIKNYYNDYPLSTRFKEKNQTHISEELFRKIISHVRLYSDIDFSHYKKPTLFRRIIRRMAVCQIKNPDDYIKYLKTSKEEVQVLVQELLIQVSWFFRDPGVFEDICEKLVIKISSQKSKNQAIRIWCAGCATGEEVYSIAMSLYKELERKNKLNYYNIQIFGTDVSDVAIEKARKAIYKKSELENLSPELIQTFFVQTIEGYQINKKLRDSIVFAKHNMLTDPPLAKMDLISCRNVLIYFDSFLQKRVLETFHFALNSDGVLVLGKSETAGTDSDLFLSLSKKNKSYTRKSGKGKYYRLPFKSGLNKSKEIGNTISNTHSKFDSDIKKQAQDIVLSSYAPTYALIDDNFQVIHTQGKISEFLQLQSGKPSYSILNMVSSSMAFEIRNGIHKLQEGNNDIGVFKKEVQYTENKSIQHISIEIVSITKSAEPHFLIVFNKVSKTPSFIDNVLKIFKTVNRKDESVNQKNAALEKELALTRADMQKIGERQSQVNQELQTTNEELLSNNEEMQSLNEELETSKEEVLSTNEELVILNQELLEKHQQLQNSLIYTEGIITTLREPFLVLDNNLNIVSANTSFKMQFMVMESQLEGMSLNTIQQGQWNNKELNKLLLELIPKKTNLVDFELNLALNGLGQRTLYLNAKEISYLEQKEKMILLAIEDATERLSTLEKYKTNIAKLNKANEHLENFARVASHDLQEPLRKIQTFSNLINHNQVENKDLYLRKIEKSAQQMSFLIKDLLTYSRISDKEELFVKTDLNETLKNILYDLELIIETKKAKISIDELPKIDAIPVQMRQLFTNIITNSLKFSKEGEIPLIKIYSKHATESDISAHGLNDNKKYTKITVSDNGIGLDQKNSDKVFTIFRRLHAQSEYEGSGIGLALCKAIVVNHGGHIFIESELGQGAKFNIILPHKRQPPLI